MKNYYKDFLLKLREFYATNGRRKYIDLKGLNYALEKLEKKEMNRDFSVHCDHCQSFPDGYYCSYGANFHKGKDGNWSARECWYQHLYRDEWTFHPCPFFTGEIRFHEDENGNYYGQGKYARIQVPSEDGEFTQEQLIEECVIDVGE